MASGAHGPFVGLVMGVLGFAIACGSADDAGNDDDERADVAPGGATAPSLSDTGSDAGPAPSSTTPPKTGLTTGPTTRPPSPYTTPPTTRPTLEPTDARAEYPEAILCVADDPRCGPGFSPDHALSDEDLEVALEVGLAAWTFPASNGGACVSCHSPDGIDLARIGYSDCDIRRRALDHVDEVQADAIVNLIHALRQIYDVQRPLHPDEYRPLQPAHEPFGPPADDVDIVSTDSQDARDALFANYLVEDLELTWAKDEIDSLELAQQAYHELVTLDLHSVRLGIPFDRFSEDPVAATDSCGRTPGPGHSGQSIFEWVPDIATIAKAGSEEAWNELLNDYLEDPSTRNLWRYYDAIDELTECGHLPNGDWHRACEWMRFKYKSVQVLQHMLRHDLERHPDQLADERVGDEPLHAPDFLDKIIARSPIWEAADVIRVAPLERRGNPECFSSDSHPCTFLPPRIDESIHSVPTHADALINQGDLFQLSWFVMSFLNDPTLTTHGDNFATFIGDYLESVMLPRYDVHHAFIVAVMAARKAAASEWLDAPGFRGGTGKIASVRTFSFKQLRDNLSPPASGPRRVIHERLFANFARMWIYLIEDDLRTSGTVYGRDGAPGGAATNQGGLLSAVRFMRDWIPELEGEEDADINRVVASIEELASAAIELRSAENYDDYDGLQPTGRWADYQSP